MTSSLGGVQIDAARIEGAKATARSLLETLVALPTWEPQGAAGALETLRDWIRERGIDGELHGKDGRVLSMTATVGGNEGSDRLPVEGRRLVFNSHVDTVPPSNPGGWRFPPLSPTEAGGRLYGLGACDAKGCVAAMAAAFVLLAENWRGPSGLQLMIVDGEERGGLGTRLEVERGMQGSAIVGEPTSLVPMIAAKGAIRCRIAAHGKAAHASQPQAGVNAIYPIAALAGELEALASRVARRTDRWTGSASLAVTLISGGTAANVIPAECAIHVDRRLVPGEPAGEAEAQIREAVARVQRKYPDAALRVEVYGVHEAPATPEGAVIVDVAKAARRRLAAGGPAQERAAAGAGSPGGGGTGDELGGFGACCDISLIVHEARLPGIIWGPGSLESAHQVNESLPLDEFEKAIECYYFAGLEWQHRWAQAPA